MIYSKDCLAKFGDPTPEFERTWMTLLENNIGGVIPKRIYCNKLLAPVLLQALTRIKQEGHLHLITSWDGCFNIRKSRTSQSYSLHSWGVAVDINAASNKLGAQPKLPLVIVKAFTEAGMDWGGDWKLKDGMHFQLNKI